jgi:hypothetical protein
MSRDTWRKPKLWVVDATILLFTPLLIFWHFKVVLAAIFGIVAAFIYAEFRLRMSIFEMLIRLRRKAIGRRRKSREIIARARILDMGGIEVRAIRDRKQSPNTRK